MGLVTIFAPLGPSGILGKAVGLSGDFALSFYFSKRCRKRCTHTKKKNTHLLFHSHMPMMASTGPGRSREPGTPSKPPTWVTGTQQIITGGNHEQEARLKG